MVVIERNFEDNIGIINPEPYEKEYFLFKVENKDSSEDCKIMMNVGSIINCEPCIGDLTKYSITLGFESNEQLNDVLNVLDLTYERLINTLYERRDEWFNGFEMDEISSAFSPLYKRQNELSLVIDCMNPENIDVALNESAKVVCQLDGILFYDGDFQAKLDIVNVDTTNIEEDSVKLVTVDSDAVDSNEVVLQTNEKESDSDTEPNTNENETSIVEPESLDIEKIEIKPEPLDIVIDESKISIKSNNETEINEPVETSKSVEETNFQETNDENQTEHEENEVSKIEIPDVLESTEVTELTEESKNDIDEPQIDANTLEEIENITIDNFDENKNILKLNENTNLFYKLYLLINEHISMTMANNLKLHTELNNIIPDKLLEYLEEEDDEFIDEEYFHLGIN